MPRGKRQLKTRFGEQGFTLVEVVFAILILTVMATGIVYGYSEATNASIRLSARNGALGIASQRIESARNLPYDSVGTNDGHGHYGNPAGSILTPETTGTYTIVTSVRVVLDNATPAYKKVTVTVSYSNPGGAVSLSTNIYGISSLVNVGSLQVIAEDVDSLQPLAGATIKATPQAGGTTLSDTTDNSGTASFYGLAPGGYDVTGAATGYLDLPPGAAGTQTVAADMVTTCNVFLQRPSTLFFHVVDSNGAYIPGAQVAVAGPYSYSTTQSAASGDATLTNRYIGSYTYTASAPGYFASRDTTSITAGNQSVTVPITLVQAARLLIVVQDTNGNRLSAASVAVSGPNETTTSPVTGSPFASDAQGQVALGGLAPGHYTVQGTKSTYIGGSTIANATPGATTTVTLVLTPTVGDLIVEVWRSGSLMTNQRLKVTGPSGYASGDLWTDSNGRVTLTALNPGTYLAWLYKNNNPNRGYQSTSQASGAVVAGNQTLLHVDYPW